MKQSLLLDSQTKSLNHKIFSKAVPIVLLIALLSLMWNYSDDLKLLLETKAIASETQCDFQGQLKCDISTKLGDITLTVDREIQSLTPFMLSIKSLNPQWQRAEIRFEGFYDYMGINKFDFTVDSQNDHLWHAKGSIPICTTEAKTWRVIVNLITQETVSSHWFKIKTN